MINRKEYKYLVPKTSLDSFRSEIQPYIEVDQYARNRNPQEYTVRSVYFDTSEFDYLNEKREGIKVRKKLRIRCYNKQQDDSIAFLEIKRKHIDFIEKNRAPVLHQDIEKLFLTRNLDEIVLSFNGNGKEKSDAQRFLYHYYRHGLCPTVLVIYEREAFFGKFDNTLRLTFDKNLRSAVFPSREMLYDDKQARKAMNKYFVFEVKFYGGLPAWIRSVIRHYQLSRMALSKYVICLDSHHMRKKVPSRIISRHFPYQTSQAIRR
ncbi:MAG: polyphosphate polymerase domain-containing protein [candidate division Zixibacteria bacterium]|nr:polyphosphate polymerase domain-containing protein [candidate division Zixibacteria bacterium]